MKPRRELRPDQQDAIDQIDEALAEGHRRICLQAPTAFGKTVLGAALAEREQLKKNRVLWTVPAIGLVDQTVVMLYEQGVSEVGVMQASHEMTDWRQPVQVASIQTLLRRELPETNFAMVDECHRMFNFYNKWFFRPEWSDIPIIGLSATPWSKGLGRYYSKLIIAGTTQEMIDAGHLSDFKVFAPSHPDLTGVQIVGGDYHEGQLADVMGKAKLVGEVVDTWLRLGENRPTLCFAVDRAHAKMLQERFLSRGIRCEYQDAYTKDFDRSQIRRRFHNREIDVVCNVGTLTTGVDWDVRCIIFARPTRSEILFVQIAGRGLRTAEGKDYCLFLDHSDNHLRLGFVTDIIHTELDDGTKKPAVKVDPIKLPKECPKCSYVKPPRQATCPNCGHTTVVEPKAVHLDGELQELKRKPRVVDGPAFAVPKDIYRQLLCVARGKNFKHGWVSHKFNEIYNRFPPDRQDLEPMEPCAELLSWLKSQQIRWAHSKKNTERKKHRKASAGRDTKTTLTTKEQEYIDAVKKKFIPGTLMTPDDDEVDL